MFKRIFVLFCVIAIFYECNAQDKTKLTSISIKEAIDLAIKNHPEINMAKYDIEAANARYLREISLPPLNVSLTKEGIPSGKDLSGYDEQTLEISQFFDFPSIYFSKAGKSNAEINSLKYKYDTKLNSLRASVKKAYYSTLSKFQILKIAQENLEITNEFFKKAEIRFKVGEGTNLELLTAKNQLSEAKALIEASQKEYQTTLTELNVLMGNVNNIDPVNIIFTDSLTYKSNSFSLQELTNKSLSSNSSLKVAEFDIEAAKISKTLAWSSLLPSFNLSYLSQNLGGNSNFYGVRFGANLPIWFMMDQTGQIGEAAANYEISTYQFNNVKNQIIQKINAAYIDFQYDDKQVNLYINELNPQIDEIFKTANLSYKVGEITYLEFLQAKITTINSRINFVKTLYDYEEAIINLEESTGLILE